MLTFIRETSYFLKILAGTFLKETDIILGMWLCQKVFSFFFFFYVIVGLPEKEQIFSHESYFFPLRVSYFLRQLYVLLSKQEVTKIVCCM